MFLAKKLNKGGSLGGYQISRSLRFNSADSAYLNRTPASATNRTTWTWSGWVKRSSFGTDQQLFSAGGSGAFQFLYQSSTECLQIYDSVSSTTSVITTQVFRDPSAWYHVVLATDTTQATASNRFKLYINGSQVTSFGTATYPAQNSTLSVNNTVNHSVGSWSGSGGGNFFSGYMTEVNFIDGQALTPSSFGETNAQTGVWQPKAYSGSYGTNGFYLNFSDNSNTTAATLGKDYSGNGNNWTPNNFSVTAGAGNDSLVDSPTSYGTDTGVGGTVRGNYSTMNPVNKGSTVTLSNGNLDQVTASGGWNSARASIAVASGKWYWEVTITGTTQAVMHGVDDNAYNVTTNPSSSYVGAYTNSWSVYASNGQKRNNTGSGTAYGSAFAQNDVMMVAMDMDSGKIWWGKNGTWFASGDPVAGTNAAYTNLSGYTLNPATSGFDTTDSCTHNFGQRPFAYTAPSGYKALCTQNLPTPTIGATSTTLATSYFNPATYTGTNATQSITTGFQPDLVWIKSRSQVSRNTIFDAVRGVTKVLWSDSTDAEGTASAGTGLTSLNSNGFTLGTEISGTSGSTNVSGVTYVAWNWKANGAGSTNTAGSITSTVSANTTSGFSVVTYTGNGTSPSTVGHGLGVAPSMMIFKARSVAGNSWDVYHSSLGATQYLLLNTTAAVSTSSWLNNTAPTSTVFTLSNFGDTNANGVTYVAYCFAEVAGYSKFGSYTGNGSADGVFVYCGFRPAYVMIKLSSAAGDSWQVFDAARDTSNVMSLKLQPNLSNAESSLSAIDFVSNGFKLRDSNSAWNGSGNTYIFACFATAPFKYSLAR